MRFFKKKKIVLPKIQNKLPTLEEVAESGVVGDFYYFRIEVDEVVLYKKTPKGYNTKRFKLPLRCIDITHISTKCKGSRDFWKNEITLALVRHWEKF